jgi:secreted trypsin-like serine protease
VSIHIDNAWLCGGSLILNNWVATAAHCTYNRNNFVVKIGSVHWYNVPADGYTITNVTKYEHPNYNPTSLNNDVTLLKLITPSVTPNGKVNLLVFYLLNIFSTFARILNPHDVLVFAISLRYCQILHKEPL